MDLFGLGTYKDSESSGTSSSEDEEAGPAVVAQPTSSEDSATSDSSVDSATQRAREAAARLKDFESKPAVQSTAKGTALPAPSDAFDEVDGVPDFLDPEAIRPIATSAAHGQSLGGLSALGSGAGRPQDKSKVPGKEFDIARLAPPMKGQKRPGEEERGPPGAVIEAKAKKYKQEEAVQYTDLQIAMMGGHVRESTSTGGPVQPTAPQGVKGPVPPPAAADQEGKGRGPTSRPQDVAEFLAQGEGAALLPRKGQDRKDKEKLKRSKGQSSVHGWKSEAEMVLRQQFDS